MNVVWTFIFTRALAAVRLVLSPTILTGNSIIATLYFAFYLVVFTILSFSVRIQSVFSICLNRCILRSVLKACYFSSFTLNLSPKLFFPSWCLKGTSHPPSTCVLCGSFCSQNLFVPVTLLSPFHYFFPFSEHIITPYL